MLFLFLGVCVCVFSFYFCHFLLVFNLLTLHYTFVIKMRVNATCAPVYFSQFLTSFFIHVHVGFRGICYQANVHTLYH